MKHSGVNSKNADTTSPANEKTKQPQKSSKSDNLSIELEFHYNSGASTLFFHNTHSCPKIRQKGGCLNVNI